MQQKSNKKTQLSQADKIKQGARDLEFDPNGARWEDKLRRVVKHKPVEKKGVRLAQKIIAGAFALFSWLVAFGAMTSVNHDQQWIALASLLLGLCLSVWALNPDITWRACNLYNNQRIKVYSTRLGNHNP